MLQGILEDFRIWFGLIWIIFAKDMKQNRKQKIEKVSEQKKKGRKGLSHLGQPGAQLPASSPTPAEPAAAR
jgi:hypothetical protein